MEGYMRHDVEGGWIEVRDDGGDAPNSLVRRVRGANANISVETYGKLAPRRHVDHKDGEPCTRKCESVASFIKRTDSLNDDELERLWALDEAIAVASITAWSFDVPITREGLQSLPDRTYRSIVKITAPKFQEMLPSFEPNPDADSPFASLSESNG